MGSRPSTSRAPAPTRAELGDAFGLVVHELRRHPVGYESECWVADDRWFVKVWRHGPPHNQLDLLDELASSGLPVPVALRTRDGLPTAISHDRTYAVFPYVVGRHAGTEDAAEVGRALRRVHATTGVTVAHASMDEPCIEAVRARLDHPWLRSRRDEVARQVDRLEELAAAARASERPVVLAHNDFGGFNLLLGDDGHTVAMLDWDWASWAPAEHDLWLLVDTPRAAELLAAYGPADLDRTHLEYAMQARAVRDLAARVEDEVDRPGVDTWGFERWRRIPDVLAAIGR